MEIKEATKTIRKQQEAKYLLEMDRFKLLNAVLAADALQVREQFAQIKSRART